MRAIVTMLAALLAAPPVAAQQRNATPVPASAQPALPFAQALILIRSSLIAAQQANETADYDVLHRLGTHAFQSANPPQRLAQAFAATRGFNIASVLVLEPQFTELPRVDSDKSLGMAGFFLSDGYRINFKLNYAPEGGRWRMSGIALGVQPVTRGAPPSR